MRADPAAPVPQFTFSVTMVGGFIVASPCSARSPCSAVFPSGARLFADDVRTDDAAAGARHHDRVAARRGVHQIHWALQVPAGARTFVVAIGSALYGLVHYDSPLWQPLAYGGVIGLGLGGCMQTLIIAAQNAVRARIWVVSTAAATFFRQMGGTLVSRVFLTILFNLLPNKIIDAFGGQLPPGFDATQLSDIAEQYQRDRRALGRGEDTDPDRASPIPCMGSSSPPPGWRWCPAWC